MDRKFGTQGLPTPAADQGFWIGRALEARTEPTSPAFPEPRESVRRRLGVEVLINHGLTYSAPWHVRDLSLTGAFVRTEASQLPEGAYVEVVLRYRYKERAIELRLPATVARMQDDGVALTFGHYDDQTYTHLANLLYAR